MPEYRRNELKAGLMVFVSVVLLLLLWAAVKGLDLLQTTKPYRASFGFISGLEVGAPVRYGGYRVGRVDKINFSQDEAGGLEVRFSVKASTPVTERTVASIDRLDLLGEDYLELSMESTAAATLPPGSQVAGVDAYKWSRAMRQFNSFGERALTTLAEIQQTFGEETREQLQQLLGETSRLVQANADELGATLSSFSRLSQDLDSLALAMTEAVGTEGSRFAQTLERTDATLTQFSDLLQQARLQLTANQDDFQRVITDVGQAMQNLREFTALVKRRPWSLIRITPVEERKVPDEIKR